MSDIRPLSQPFGPGGLNLSDIVLPPLPTGFTPRPRETASLAHHTGKPLASSRGALPRIVAAPEILAAHFVRKSYRKAAIEIPVLQGVALFRIFIGAPLYGYDEAVSKTNIDEPVQDLRVSGQTRPGRARNPFGEAAEE
jgi:hypothetical protein